MNASRLLTWPASDGLELRGGLRLGLREARGEQAVDRGLDLRRWWRRARS